MKNSKHFLFSVVLLVVMFLGLSLRAMPADNDGYTCTICLDDKENQTKRIVITSCGHIFHGECLEPWIKSRQHCPLCNQLVDCLYNFDVGHIEVAKIIVEVMRNLKIKHMTIENMMIIQESLRIAELKVQNQSHGCCLTTKKILIFIMVAASFMAGIKIAFDAFNGVNDVREVFYMLPDGVQSNIAWLANQIGLNFETSSEIAAAEQQEKDNQLLAMISAWMPY